MPFPVPVPPDGVDPARLPPAAFRAVGSRRTLLRASGPRAETVHGELAAACARFGGRVTGDADDGPYDLVLELGGDADALGEEGFAYRRRDGRTTVTAAGRRGLLYGLFHVVRLGEEAFRGERAAQTRRPALALRRLDHWDNVAVHPVMGQVERGYAGGSLFWADGRARGDLARVRAYAARHRYGELTGARPGTEIHAYPFNGHEGGDAVHVRRRLRRLGGLLPAEPA
ncbi:hypothetical protein ACIF8T_15075 [Streptomyces sp. NPDC085946]|uniref:hypothetical protein n=1 Tax=Streptomyces sp. NPDC085946 TaxID=3365744 RepID=UPI0037CEB425